MATYCPGCNRKLTFLDWHQNCPECGTNLMFHGFEERFFEDAKYAELGNAKVRVWWAKVVACFFGGKLQIMRLVFILLPIAALLVPSGTLHIALPLFQKDISFGLLGAISAFSDNTVMTAFGLSGAAVTGPIADAVKLCYIAFGAAAVSAVLIVAFELFCFFGKKVMSVLLCTASIAGIGSAVFAIVAAGGLKSAAGSFGNVFSAKSGFGPYVLILAFAAVFTVNLILTIKGITVKYKEGDLYRVDIAKKLKKGEITLDELSQPIFETEEEKAFREAEIENTMNGKSSEQEKKKEEEKAHE